MKKIHMKVSEFKTKDPILKYETRTTQSNFLSYIYHITNMSKPIKVHDSIKQVEQKLSFLFGYVHCMFEHCCKFQKSSLHT